MCLLKCGIVFCIIGILLPWLVSQQDMCGPAVLKKSDDNNAGQRLKYTKLWVKPRLELRKPATISLWYGLCFIRLIYDK